LEQETALALAAYGSQALILRRTLQIFSSEVLTMILARASMTSSSGSPLAPTTVEEAACDDIATGTEVLVVNTEVE
jgi:hypothetical protein